MDMTKTIPQWSASKLKTFSQCKFRAYIQYALKIAEPERPLPPGKTEHANDRGTRIHQEAEDFVRGKGPMGREMLRFKDEFESLRVLFSEGRVSLEGEWAMNDDWDPAEWRSNEAWLRLKLDAMVFLSDTEAIVIDYKSGRRFGNEVAHAEQVQLYQLVAFLRYPKLEVVHTELWYLDQDEMAEATFARHQGLRLKMSFQRKGLSITDCIDFPANPNIFSCKYCPYGSWGTGHCTKGVKK